MYAEATMTDPGSFADHAPDLALGAAEPAYWAVVDEARERRWANRLFDRDVSLWTSDDAVAATIADRLGWLDAPEHFTQRIPGLEGFGDGIVEAGFTTVVVAGMGGSSLAPDVLHRTFGSQDGYLDLRLLDSTDPEAVSAALDDLDPLTTLVIIASKSGSTTEPNAFLAVAWEHAHAALDARDHKERSRLAEAEEAAAKTAPFVPPGITRADLAAWTSVARGILNLDEFVTRE
jgi:hypothetical protein